MWPRPQSHCNIVEDVLQCTIATFIKTSWKKRDTCMILTRMVSYRL